MAKEWRKVIDDWAKYAEDIRDCTECNAFKAGLKCADDLYKKYNCDCPKWKDKQCCEDIKRYRRMAEK